jgi:hypothetical protein
LLVEAATDEEAIALVEPLRAVWLDCLIKEKLSGTAKRAFHVQSGDSVSAYISKHGRKSVDREAAAGKRPAWGIAEEMTLARTKKGKGNDDDDPSRSPWQILRDAHDGDEPSKKLWQEYAIVMHGRKQQIWSDGLKALVGLIEVKDEDAAEGEEYTEDEDEILTGWDKDEWRRVRRHRAAILAAAEGEGGLPAIQIAASGGRPRPEDVFEEDDPATRVREAKAAQMRADRADASAKMLDELLIEIATDAELPSHGDGPPGDDGSPWCPRPGGLAAMAVASVRPPPV